MATEEEQRALVGRRVLVAHYSKQATGWFLGKVRFFGVSIADKRACPRRPTSRSPEVIPAGDFYGRHDLMALGRSREIVDGSDATSALLVPSAELGANE